MSTRTLFKAMSGVHPATANIIPLVEINTLKTFTELLEVGKVNRRSLQMAEVM